MQKYKIFILLFFFICLIGAENITSFNQETKYLRDPFQTSQTGLPTSSEEIYIYNLIYRDVDGVLKILKDLYPQTCFSGEPESKQIIIKTSRNNYLNLFGKLKLLDAPLDQILIEVKVVEISQNKLEQLGILWDFGQDGITLAERTKTAEFIKQINLLLGKGDAKIMANPRITTILGNEAVIHIGDQVPYSVPVESASGKTTWVVKYIDAGINLNILPQKAEKNYISLKLRPEVATIKQWKMTPNGEFPIISSRQVETFLRLKDKESFIIGGLLNEEERENISKVPILGDIPGLDIFFKNKSTEKIKSDVLFLVTAQKV